MKNYTLNVYNLFGKKYFSEKISDEKLPDNIYRCHLVEDYLFLHGIKDEQQNILKRRTNATYGVRHSLQILSYFLRDKKWILPLDVYPVYNQILKNESIKTDFYETIIKENIFSFLANNNSDVLLICDPLKPKSRTLENELGVVKEWLKKDENRVLIVDAVYNTEMNFNNSEYIKLQEEGFNIIFLHSLAKTFCLPKTFGIMLLPHLNTKLYQELRSYCQKIEKNINMLILAYIALNLKKEVPDLIKKEIIDFYYKFQKEYPDIKLPQLNKENPSYLFVVNKKYTELSRELECFSPNLYILGKNDEKNISEKYTNFSIISTLEI